MLTGRYQQRFGHESNPAYDEQDNRTGIDTDTRLLPDLLKAEGYATGLIGKWHVGAGEVFRPMERGFTDFYGFLGGGHSYFEAKAGRSEYAGPLWRDRAPTDDKISYLTDDLTAEAESFIDRHADRPFCLLLMYNAPHAPDHVTDKYMQRVASIKDLRRRKYAALIQAVDEGVKRVVAKVDSSGLRDNTMIVFLSDNGGRRSVSDNRPLRGNKGWLHEGGIRVPLIIRYPGELASNIIYDRPVSALDLLPTALVVAGLPVPDDCDGVDLMPFLTGGNQGAPHPVLYWRVAGGAGMAIREGDWKLVRDIGMKQPELYNLRSDPGENRDLSQSQSEELSRLQRRYKLWTSRLESPRWSDGHIRNTTQERASAAKAGTRQAPLVWERD